MECMYTGFYSSGRAPELRMCTVRIKGYIECGVHGMNVY